MRLVQVICYELSSLCHTEKGDIAQLAERLLSMQEVRGSIPFISTFVQKKFLGGHHLLE